MNKTESHEALSAVKTAQTTIKNAIAELRSRIETNAHEASAHTAEIQRLRSLPISFDDFGQYLAADIARMGQVWFGQSNILAKRSHETANNEKAWGYFEESRGRTSVFPEMHKPGELERGTSGTLGALCFFSPELVYGKLMEAYRTRCAARWGNTDLPTVAQRQMVILDLSVKRSQLLEEKATLEAELADLTGGLLPTTAPAPGAVVEVVPSANQQMRKPVAASER